MPPIENPRRVTVSIPEHGKQAGAYRFSPSVKRLLIGQGWQHTKDTRGYAHFIPPAGKTKPFTVEVEIPDRAQLTKVANELHAGGEPAAIKLGDWIGLYKPYQEVGSYSPGEFDLLTGEQIGPATTTSDPARFTIGIITVWHVFIEFHPEGTWYSDDDKNPDTNPVPDPLLAQDDDPDPYAATFPEGRAAYREHLKRERNPKVIAEAKRLAKLKNGRLTCEGCGFDFAAVYGPRGEDFIEGHHTRPISNPDRGPETAVADIALLCANCHRMIHRGNPLLTVAGLKTLVSTHRTK